MDVFAHLVAGEVLASYAPEPRRRKVMLLAIPFATLPDLLSFGIYWGQRVLSGNFGFGRPELEAIPQYVFTMYSVTHSILIAAAATVLLGLLFRKYVLAFAAWPLHVLCDIPVHGKEFFATPLFYPISDWRFDGWSFGRNVFIILLYWAVIATWAFIRCRQLRRTARALPAEPPTDGTIRR